ncbi:MAG: hypothetical protein NTZ68_04150 [Candidatus Dependentiae bacterium]|nr:hypothetical protein [Candidatus Dependentiae bacterium]
MVFIFLSVFLFMTSHATCSSQQQDKDRAKLDWAKGLFTSSSFKKETKDLLISESIFNKIVQIVEQSVSSSPVSNNYSPEKIVESKRAFVEVIYVVILDVIKRNWTDLYSKLSDAHLSKYNEIVVQCFIDCPDRIFEIENFENQFMGSLNAHDFNEILNKINEKINADVSKRVQDRARSLFESKQRKDIQTFLKSEDSDRKQINCDQEQFLQRAEFETDALKKRELVASQSDLDLTVLLKHMESQKVITGIVAVNSGFAKRLYDAAQQTEQRKIDERKRSLMAVFTERVKRLSSSWQAGCTDLENEQTAEVKKLETDKHIDWRVAARATMSRSAQEGQELQRKNDGLAQRLQETDQQRLVEIAKNVGLAQQLQETQNQLNEEVHRNKRLAQRSLVDEAELLRLSGGVVLGQIADNTLAQYTNNVASCLTSMTSVHSSSPCDLPARIEVKSGKRFQWNGYVRR